MLKELECSGEISSVHWNGRVDPENGFARPALGKQVGLPDLIFICANKHYLLELTTIRGATQQWRAEGLSVPWHIENYITQTGNYDVQGIFCVPETHTKVKKSLDSTHLPTHHDILYVTVDEFLNILSKPNLCENLSKLNQI